MTCNEISHKFPKNVSVNESQDIPAGFRKVRFKVIYYDKNVANPPSELMNNHDTDPINCLCGCKKNLADMIFCQNCNHYQHWKCVYSLRCFDSNNYECLRCKFMNDMEQIFFHQKLCLTHLIISLISRIEYTSLDKLQTITDKVEIVENIAPFLQEGYISDKQNSIILKIEELIMVENNIPYHVWNSIFKSAKTQITEERNSVEQLKVFNDQTEKDSPICQIISKEPSHQICMKIRGSEPLHFLKLFK
ncbi:hypothetical protein RF11_14056 [Thelohanellus kitauei]|uniref:Zinc finger PHD-type domain-containing protein n=1 Tax=Thelohanellus kitauei TaxID=669202 RepID=A0A0C2NBJ5_THEKT|nr:hypothetical protein RF11_14056 [Thelohanellus kitauei]